MNYEHHICFSNIMLSAGSANQFTSEIVASALEVGAEQNYLKDLNAEYKVVTFPDFVVT